MDVVRKQKREEARRTHLALKKEHAHKAPGHTSKFYSEVLMEWRPLEFSAHERGENWYLWLGIIAAIFITVSIFTRAYIVAATFFLLAIVLVMYAQKPPKRQTFRITDTGIEYGPNFFPFHSLSKFWIIYNPPHATTLYFQKKEKISLDLSIEIEAQDPVVIRDHLMQYLPEDEEKEEDVTASLARRFKF